MALSGSVLSGLIKTNLTAKGFAGSELTNISDAVGNGIITASATLTFVTVDLGIPIIGTGVGVGVGIAGMDSMIMSTSIQTTGNALWSSEQISGPGDQWKVFCDAVSEAVISHFSIAASLSSTHSTVLNGTGIVTVYAGVIVPVMKVAIIAAAPLTWAVTKFPDLAEAVATGVVTELIGHTPTDTITIGSGGAGPTPGVGSGTVS